GIEHIYVDGGLTIQRFLQAGLIHRLIITRVPVLIGTASRCLARYSVISPSNMSPLAIFPAALFRVSMLLPPNQPLKLSGRGGRLKGKGSLLIAAAAPRSLSAIR